MRTVEELESLIKNYAQSYYSGESEVNDEYFDKLVDELKEIDPNNSLLSKPGWGFEPEGEKHKHLYNMVVGSLSKVKTISSLPGRYEPALCRVSAKLDGLTAVSYYKNGERYLSVTRGNGREGVIVTDKINMISPETRKLSTNFTGAVRGEVVMSIDTWNRIKDRYSDNESANPRNISSGILNRDGIDEDLKLLDYVVYKVIADPERIFKNEMWSDSITFRNIEGFILSNGFIPVPQVYATNSSQFSQEIFESYYKSFNLKYPCDGLVVTSHKTDYSPEGEILYDEIAYKFKSESVEVVVTDIDWNAGRTGRIIPRIWFNPVKLSGVMVKKCTGHNASFIKTNKVNIGSVIEVSRSGEVIPYCEKVVTPSESGLLPDKCPNCGSPLVWKGEDLVCESENESQLIYRFISVAGSVTGAGWSLYNKIIDVFNIDSYSRFIDFLAYIYGENTYKQAIYSEIRGTVTQQKCIDVISKIVDGIYPTTFLVACNISGISWNSAESLIVNYPEYFNDVRQGKVDYERVGNIQGFGWSTVETLKKFESRISDIAKICKITNLEIPSQVTESQFSVAITGSLSIKRSEFDALLQSKGIIQSSNFKEIKYLITNNPESTSSKMKKAKDNGVEIISEEEFKKKFL